MFKLKNAIHKFNSDMESLCNVNMAGHPLIDRLGDNDFILPLMLNFNNAREFLDRFDDSEDFGEGEQELLVLEKKLADVIGIIAMAERAMVARLSRNDAVESTSVLSVRIRYGVARAHLERAQACFYLARTIKGLRDESLRNIDYVRDFYNRTIDNGYEDEEGEEGGEEEDDGEYEPEEEEEAEEDPLEYAEDVDDDDDDEIDYEDSDDDGRHIHDSEHSDEHSPLPNDLPRCRDTCWWRDADTRREWARRRGTIPPTNDGEPPEECEICWTPLADDPEREGKHPSVIRTTECCGQVFHAHCLYEWIQEKICGRCGKFPCFNCYSELDAVISMDVIAAKTAEYCML